MTVLTNWKQGLPPSPSCFTSSAAFGLLHCEAHLYGSLVHSFYRYRFLAASALKTKADVTGGIERNDDVPECSPVASQLVRAASHRLVQRGSHAVLALAIAVIAILCHPPMSLTPSPMSLAMKVSTSSKYGEAAIKQALVSLT
jgi:hypothetical protein